MPGMFIANTIDDPQAAMPIAPMPAPQPGPGAPPAPVHNGTAYWIKVSAQTGRLVHGDQRAEWLQQDLQARAQVDDVLFTP